MAHVKVSINRNWYGKIPLDRTGKPIPKNLWPRRRKYSWEVRWFSSEGKRYSKSFKERKEAFEYAKKIQVKVDKKKADKPRKITLAEFIEEHGKVMAGQVAYTTLKLHMRVLKMFADHVGHNIYLEHIRPQHAESFVSLRSTQSLSIATVNKDIRSLKSIFGRAIEPRGYLAEDNNPFAKIKQRKVASAEPHYVPVKDFLCIFNITDSLWWKTLLALGYTSAGRKDELLNLTWADIDFENRNVRFFPKKKTKTMLAWEPKDHMGRIVPIPPETVQLLADQQLQADESTPYVFISKCRLEQILSRRSKGLWQPDMAMINNLLRDMKRSCCQAGVEEFTLHDLRRSCITNWAKQLPIQSVQHLAGHSSLETTRKYYLSVQKDDLELARDIQSKLMASLTNY